MGAAENLSQQVIGVADWISDVGRATGSRRFRRKSKRLSGRMVTAAERLVDVAHAAAGDPRPRRRGLSGQLTDLRERLEDAVDAAKDAGHRPGVESARWLVVPAVAGVAIYASARSGLLTGNGKRVIQDTAMRAAELPTDLLDTVRPNSEKQTGRTAGQRGPKTRTSGKRTGSTASKAARSRKTSTARPRTPKNKPSG